MGQCDNLIKGAIYGNCDDPIIKGLESVGIIVNRDDIDYAQIKFAEGKANVITALPLKVGKCGYEVKQPGNTPFNGTKSSLETGTNRNSFTHEVVVYIPDSGPDVAENIIDGLANGKFVMILENNYKAMQSQQGAAAFQIFGFYTGLKAASAEADKYSDDTESGWTFTLKEEKTPKSALYLFAATYAATKTLFDTLKKPVTAE